MGTIVGAEYLIANALIALGQSGVDQISVQELRDFGISVQQRCVDENVDAVFLVADGYVEAAVYNFSDYFKYKKENGIEYITINNNKPLDDIKKRFMGFIQPDALVILIQAAQTLVSRT